MSNTFLLEKRREHVLCMCVCVVIVTHVKHLKDSEKMELFYFMAKIHFTLTKHEYNIVKNSINKFCSVRRYTVLICMCLGQGFFFMYVKNRFILTISIFTVGRFHLYGMVHLKTYERLFLLNYTSYNFIVEYHSDVWADCRDLFALGA